MRATPVQKENTKREYNKRIQKEIDGSIDGSIDSFDSIDGIDGIGGMGTKWKVRSKDDGDVSVKWKDYKVCNVVWF